MKSLKYMMAAGCLLTLGLSSCSDFLDVNVDPDKPNNTTAEVANRVPWIRACSCTRPVSPTTARP